MSEPINAFPIPTREISENLSGFLSDIGATPIPINIFDNGSGSQSVEAVAGNTYQTHAGSGVLTFTDPPTLDAVSGDFYKVIIGSNQGAFIGGVLYNIPSPIEITRLFSNGGWITLSGVDASQITTGTIDTARLPSYVQSVNSRTGDVTLTKTDVGLANVDNTSDINKPISTATQTALNLKVNSITPIVLVSTATAFDETSNAKIFHVSNTTTLTLPTAAAVSDGWSIGVVNVGGSTLTVNRSSTNTINGTLTTFSNTVPYSAFYIYKSSTSAFIAIGVLY